MRDPSRIPTMLAELIALWTASPDMRLGQIVWAAAQKVSEAGETDVFFIEDDDMLRGLQELGKG